MRFFSFFMLAAAAVGVLACSGNSANYSVTGNNVPEDGAVVYLIDQITSAPIDSAVVAGGTFTMKGKADKNAYFTVNMDGDDWSYPLFNDGKPVQINFADKTLTGSALNENLTECDKRSSDAYAEYNSFIQAFMSLPQEEQDAREEEFMKEYEVKLQEYTDVRKAIIEENMNNLIPVAFISQVPSLMGEEKLEELLASGAAFATHPYVTEFKRKLDASTARRKAAEEAKQAIIGQKFLDLEEADVDGNMHKLSEYVGQGKWVLVDFWASWCGPCKAEMPNVVAAYKKYHAKGFEIVGLSFDREKEPWVEAISEWEMPWIHLSDLKYWKSVAADVYSVNSIPDNLLIDPEGTVVARYLRGNALEEKLAEIFN